MAKLQLKLYLFLFAIILLVVITLASFFSGMFYQKSRVASTTEKVTAQTIVNKISDQAFLVTKTVYLNQKTDIKVDQGSDWNNFWWGQTINAEALIRADVGVDYAQIKAENIKIDHLNKTVKIIVPDAKILDINPTGDIQVTSKSGILKLLLANDPSADRNQAAKELTNQAAVAIEKDPQIFQEAQKSSNEVLKLLVSEFGYDVIIESGTN
ncbi:MAG: DUF4230 domain-containing protein [bacterium]